MSRAETTAHPALPLIPIPIPALTPALTLTLTLIAAVARNGAIGRGGDLLWRDPADQRHFRALTMGHPVVMGRKTWDSLPERFRPLPGRRNVVVSRQRGLQLDGAETVASLDAALALLHAEPCAFVIGGGELYAEALPLADTLELTEIDAALDGDTFFPPWPREGFVEAVRKAQQATDGTAFAFVTYRRAV